jgi:hypothetical protein
MPGLRGLFTTLATGCAVLGASSCGPSVQSIYEGNVRFEHCYRLDLDLEIVPTHRRHCWEQWLESYRYGQPRDRVEYARRRLRLFASGDFERPLLEIESAAPPGSGQSSGLAEATLVRPEPTSVRAPPPAIIPGVGVESKASDPNKRPLAAPGDGCADVCAHSRAACLVESCPSSLSRTEDGGVATGQVPGGEWQTKSRAAGGAASTGVGPACARCDQDYKSCMRRCFE